MMILAQFAIYLAVLSVFFIIILIAMAGFCTVVKSMGKKKDINPRLMKWAEVLDWLKEEDE